MSLGIGILGTGGIATRVATSIDAADGAHIAAVLSRDASRAASLARPRAAAAYTDLDELLGDSTVDAVYIATPNALHARQTIASLQAGKHVLVEKPMALDVSDAEAMAAASIAAQRVLAVGFHMRFHPAHAEMRRLVARGDIGDPVLAQGVFGSSGVIDPAIWQVDPELAGFGSLTGLGVHLLDLIPWVLQLPLSEVVALDDADGASRRVDYLTGCIARATDALVEITSSRRLPNAANSLVVYGTTCRLDALGTIGVEPAGSLRRTTNGATDTLAFDLHDHYQTQIEAFSRAAAGRDGGALATAADGVTSVRTAAAVAEAARTGQRVRLPAPSVDS